MNLISKAINKLILMSVLQHINTMHSTTVSIQTSLLLHQDLKEGCHQ